MYQEMKNERKSKRKHAVHVERIVVKISRVRQKRCANEKKKEKYTEGNVGTIRILLIL